jgi:HSP20 family protein
MSRIHRSLSPLRDDVPMAGPWRRAGEAGPPADLYETADTVVIRLALPGAEGASLSVTIADESVTIRGESPPPGPLWEERTAVHWQEIPFGRFERTVPLPVPVNPAASRAQFKNGLLDVTLAKQGRHVPRTVEIKVG